MKVKIAKWGNSLGVRLPKAAVDAAGLTPSAEVDVIVKGGDLRLSRVAKIPSYRLVACFGQIDETAFEDTVGAGLKPAPTRPFSFAEATH